MTSSPLPHSVLIGGSRHISLLRHEAWRDFRLVLGCALIALVLFTTWVGFGLGGPAVTAVVDDLGLAGFQFAAAISCFVAARRMSSRYRLPWVLLGAAAASIGVGQMTWSFEELVLGTLSPFPSPADLGNLVALPLSVIAGLTFPSAPGRIITRGRALVYGGITAITLLLLAWAFGMADIYGAASGSVIGQVIGLTYLSGQAIVLTVLMQALGRAGRPQRARLSMVTGGMIVNIAAITVFAFLTGAGRFGPSDRMLDGAFALVYLIFMVAPLWPGSDREHMAEEGPSKAAAIALPLIAAGAAAVAVLALRLLDGPIKSPVPGILLATLVLLLILSQLLTYGDSLQLLSASKRAEGELRDRTALLGQVIGHTPAGLARIALDLTIVDANPRLCSLLRVTNSAIAGADLGRYFPRADLAAAAGQVQHHHQGPLEQKRQETAEAQSRVTRSDGTLVWMRWSLTAVRSSNGDVDYFLLLCEDTEAQHEAEKAAIANLAGLEKLNRLKSEFISVVSHEFRTALTGIQGFSEILRDTDLPAADVKQFAGDIFDDAIRLNRLITDLLDLDKMEAGRMTAHISTVEINTIAGDAVERARVTTNSHTIRLELDPAVPPVAGDRDRLVQVMANLLSNAVKYSPQGGEVLVRTRIDGDAVHVTVKDHGQGIPPEFMDRLFERYERYETALAGAIVGTGLGLVIARRIVEGHGGRIWAESKIGQGSEFHFTIPLHGVSAMATNPPASRPATAAQDALSAGALVTT